MTIHFQVIMVIDVQHPDRKRISSPNNLNGKPHKCIRQTDRCFIYTTTGSIVGLSIKTPWKGVELN